MWHSWVGPRALLSDGFVPQGQVLHVVPGSNVPCVPSEPGFWPHYQASWVCSRTRLPKTPSRPVWEGVGGCGRVCPSGRPINHPRAERTNKRKALRPGWAALLGGEVWGGLGRGSWREGGQNSPLRVETEMQEVRGRAGSARPVPREAGTGPDHRAPCPHGLLHTPLSSGGAITLKHPLTLPCACLHVCFSLYYLHFPRL